MSHPKQADLESLIVELINGGVELIVDERAEIAHEALLREWATLQVRLQEDRANLVLRQDVTAATEARQRSGRSDDALWRGGRLTRAAEVCWRRRCRSPSRRRKETSWRPA